MKKVYVVLGSSDFRGSDRKRHLLLGREPGL